MISKNKKWLNVIGVTLIIVLLSACGNSNNSAPDESEKAQEENEESNTEDANTEGSDSKEDNETSGESEKSDENANQKSKQDGVIKISAFEMGYDPDSITLKKGKEYELVLTNDGSVFHDLTSSDLKAEITFKGEMPDHPDNVTFFENIFGVNRVHAEGDHGGGHDDSHNDDQQDGDSHGDGHGHSEQTLHMNAKQGQTVRVKFIPKEVGEFEFFCSIPGHKEAGMVGKIKVVE